MSGGIFSCPKKSKLNVGESSAFFTYVKSKVLSNDSPRFGSVDENLTPSEHLISNVKSPVSERHDVKEAWERTSHQNNFPNCENVIEASSSERSPLVSMPMEYQQGWTLPRESLLSVQLHSSDEGQGEVSGVPPLSPLHFCLRGMTNQIMMPSSALLYQGNLHDVPNTSADPPQYKPLPQCPHIPVMTPFSYYPVGIGMQPGQLPRPHMWPSLVSSSSSPEVKFGHVERREAALIKFRQKRKDRCFDKKIRYVNRKRLAEKRPRVRGQFVRQVNGVDVDLNGHPFAGDDSDDDEQEDQEDEEDTQ